MLLAGWAWLRACDFTIRGCIPEVVTNILLTDMYVLLAPISAPSGNRFLQIIVTFLPQMSIACVPFRSTSFLPGHSLSAEAHLIFSHQRVFPPNTVFITALPCWGPLHVYKAKLYSLLFKALYRCLLPFLYSVQAGTSFLLPPLWLLPLPQSPPPNSILEVSLKN